MFCFLLLEKELNYRAMNVVLTSANTSDTTIRDSLGKPLRGTGNVPSPLPVCEVIEQHKCEPIMKMNTEMLTPVSHARGLKFRKQARSWQA